MPEALDKALPMLASAPVLVYASVGLGERAHTLATRFTHAYTFLTATLDVRLALLSQADWPRFTASPYYGAVFYDYPQRTVIAGTCISGALSAWIADELGADALGRALLRYN